MPANHPIWEEDFASYANEAAVKSAYPDSDLGRFYNDTATDFSVTGGPDGQPGVFDQPVGATSDTGAIERFDLAPTCRGFSVEARFNCAATNHVLISHPFINIGWTTELDAATIIVVTRIHASASLRVFVQTVAPYGNAGDTDVQTFSGVLPTSTPVTITVRGDRSTIVETSPGVFAPDADGSVSVLLNGVEVYAFTGPVWNGRSDINPTPYWNTVIFHTIGALSDIEVWDEVGCDVVTEPPFCPCGSVPRNPPKLPPPTPPRRPPRDPMIGMQLACTGEGDVPVQADFPQPESWWGL